MLARTEDLVAAAAGGRTGICAFNVITLEHAEAIVAGSAAAQRPVILQISQNAVAFHQGELEPLAAAASSVATAASVPVALHLDHVTEPDLLHQAARWFSSLMFDGSALPFDENVARTAAAVAVGRRDGLWVEGELGEVGGKGGAHRPGVRTDPVSAKDFVAATGVDGLAVAVGSSHAMTDRSARLDLALIAALRAVQPAVLVLHGSSGVPDDDLAGAVVQGITKVNIGTALNVAYTQAVREHLGRDQVVVDPRRPLASARAAMAGVVEHFARLLSP